MGLLDYFYIVSFVIFVLLVVYELILSVVNSQRFKKISRKIAVKKSIKLSIVWIILSVSNSFLQFEQYKTAFGKNDDTNAKLHFFAFISWAICGIAYIMNIFFDKYIYITPDGLFYKNVIKIQPKEKYSYRVDGNILELYYKQSYKPAKYSIIENKDELIKLLEENYTPYSDEF